MSNQNKTKDQGATFEISKDSWYDLAIGWRDSLKDSTKEEGKNKDIDLSLPVEYSKLVHCPIL